MSFEQFQIILEKNQIVNHKEIYQYMNNVYAYVVAITTSDFSFFFIVFLYFNISGLWINLILNKGSTLFSRGPNLLLYIWILWIISIKLLSNLSKYIQTIYYLLRYLILFWDAFSNVYFWHWSEIYFLITSINWLYSYLFFREVERNLMSLINQILCQVLHIIYLL